MAAKRERCGKRYKADPLPPSFTVENARTHPRYRYCLEPGAQCELDAGHAEPHRCGELVWHDPVLIFVGGELHVPSSEPWTLLGEIVHPDAPPPLTV